VSGNGTIAPRPPAALAVRFIRAWRHYWVRDVALFPRREAIELLRLGVAEYVDLATVHADPIVK
jgi:hypothetical protein